MVDVNNTPDEIVIARKDIVGIKGVVSLDCAKNIVSFDSINVHILLSKRKKRLMLCLMNNITCKRKIIQIIWCENHKYVLDNNYHQLIHQFRTLLVRHNIPAALIKTLPHYGVVLNTPVLSNLSKPARSANKPHSAGFTPPVFECSSVLNIRFS
ncbi:helix-turn-helix domain-containing protein [Pantoea sp. Mb-10]|uniref:winged helix-turn-helix domain-containing protein n=1 Tax=unclassified Pantoea TaxID=2630326 RepID=UPI001E4E4E2C|nr:MULTISPECIES: helix-turn-helix domain-containing protein [unclassified Pantoea]MCE0489045.1 helix-turn-helix domain-containing protein [Pantoea sp. Mb-10]MCE0503599.1 helix-turn-helix domain-containing protein [Pantoea sp. Pb-8]